MRRYTLSATFASLITLIVSPLALAADRVELTMNLQPGDSHTMVLDVDQAINQTLMGQQMNMNQLIGMTMTYTGIDRPSENGGVWIEVTYDRVRFKMNGPMAVDFDSDAPAPTSNPMAQGFGALVGQKLAVEFLPNGDVPNVEGIAEMQQKMVDAMGMPDGPQKSAAAEALKMQFNEDAIKQMVASMGGMYPDGPVARGDTWADTLEMTGMTPMSIKTDYSLKDYDEATATLDLSGKISPNLNADPVVINDMKMDAEFNGTQSGQVVLDRASGWVVSSVVEQDMKGGMTMNLPDGQTMKIDMAITSKITMKPAE